CLARALGPANAFDLGRVLRPAAVVEQIPVDRELDAVRAQMVGETQRKRRRHARVLDAQLTASAHSDLELHLPALLALCEQLVEPELLERQDRQLRRLLADTRDLERVEDDDAAA